MLDLSMLFWNKDLFKEAGLDPEKAPANLAEFAEAAKAIQALNKPGVYGTATGLNCGGCLVFTWFPSHLGRRRGGHERRRHRVAARQRHRQGGLLAPGRTCGSPAPCCPSSKDEAGPTWTAGFTEGKVGLDVLPGDAALRRPPFDVGVAGIPGPEGGASTFVGGDGIGVSKDSKKAAQAWNFLQLDDVRGRPGRACWRRTTTWSRAPTWRTTSTPTKDPRLVTINEVAGKGDTPVALNFQQAFNAPNSPWLTLVRNAVLGDGDVRRRGQRRDHRGARAVVARRAGRRADARRAPPAHRPRRQASRMTGHASPPRGRTDAGDAVGRDAPVADAAPSAPRRAHAAGSTPLPTALFVLLPVRRCRCCSCCRCRRPTGRCSAATRAELPGELHEGGRQPVLLATRSCSPLKYTVLATILLLALGLGLALLVQESTRWKGLLRTSFLVPSALGLASASLLFYVLYSPIAGPFADLMAALGLHVPRHARRRPCGRRCSSSSGATPGFYMLLMLVGPAGHPRRRLRGGPHRRRHPLADVPAASRSRCCGRRSR